MTTIKQFTDNKIHVATVSPEMRIAQANAAKEHLEAVSEALAKDLAVLQDIYKALGYTGEEDVWKNIPTRNHLADDKVVHASYLNLIARSLLRSESMDFSEHVRTRFAIKALIRNPEASTATATTVSNIRSKYINLLDLHGEVKEPGLMEKFKAWVDAIFAKITGDAEKKEPKVVMVQEPVGDTKLST